ncbi:4-alpha-glucanotransferase [Sphingobium bisphenolivorans]|uniref:4-alpha-glucanotransferase n=1 Tax=Sphingobium bisphenolivorans TaxID=1335760 RepID=UPI000399D8DB|nr:4-alpha-glucanotransferase [Sphingobium bisphenolivorans]
MSALHELADEAGLARCWTDADGRAQTVADEALAAILKALGYDAATEPAIAESRRLVQEQTRRFPALISADAGHPIRLPAVAAELTDIEAVAEDGRAFAMKVRDGMLPPFPQAGYYRLKLGHSECLLAVAPPACVPLPEGKRAWGAAVQIPALRGKAAKGFGDLGDVADAARLLAHAGADAIAISPVHALYPGDGGRFSPYSPSSRRFVNGFLGNPALLGLSPLPEAADPALIDWVVAIPDRLVYLRALFDALPPDASRALEAWVNSQGDALHCHALFDALYLHHRRQGLHDWRHWPEAFRTPHSPAVSDFAASHVREIAFHRFVQWLGDRSMEAAQKEALDAGMSIGLIADLAVGIDPGGSDAWAMQNALLSGLSVGAPPDPLGPEGQNWGLTGFSPQGLKQTAFAAFISTLRANLRHAGALRIDHSFGLKRLWVVPEGASASEGAYLAYPFDDMLRLVALESHRAEAAIIAEDLGTVPEGFREAISARGIYGMRVLWFEREEGGRFCPAASYDVNSVTMTGTHDTATIAGWWKGRDLEWNRILSRGNADERARDVERTALWDAIGDRAAQPDPQQTEPAVDAALRHVASTPAALAIFPLEDLAGLDEQPNLPGTVDEHPNWRRRMPVTLDMMMQQPAVNARVRAIRKARCR